MSKKYRVGIIGTGRMGGLIEDEISANSFMSPYGHYSAYSSIEQTEVVAIANRSEGRLQKFSNRFGIKNTYLDYKEMIKKEDLDIVSVTTPSHARALPIIFAAENGVRGIYAEKGLCSSLAEADDIYHAIKSNKVAFNWGAMRRHHDGYLKLKKAISEGEIGTPMYVMVFALTDLIKHHPHTLDTVATLIGDPRPLWVEGSFLSKEELISKMGGDESKLSKISPKAYPKYDPQGKKFLPPPGEEIADPMVGFYRVGYENGIEAVFVPIPNMFDFEVYGSAGRVYSWDNGETMHIRKARWDNSVDIENVKIFSKGDGPTVSTINEILKEIEFGEKTTGNIDVTMQTVEIQFALAQSHLNGGARVEIPLQDRSILVPGG